MEKKPKYLLVFSFLHILLCGQTMLVIIFPDPTKVCYEDRNAGIQLLWCMLLMTINNTVWYHVPSYDKFHLVVICAVLMATPTFNPDAITIAVTFKYCQISIILLWMFISTEAVSKMPQTVGLL